MTNQELRQQIDTDQFTGKISFEQWSALSKALDKLDVLDNTAAEIENLRTGYTKAEENCKGCIGPCGACENSELMEAQSIAAQKRIEELEAERENVRKMRKAQKAFFQSTPGSAARLTALEDSRRLERWVDAALAPKETPATLFS